MQASSIPLDERVAALEELVAAHAAKLGDRAPEVEIPEEDMNQILFALMAFPIGSGINWVSGNGPYIQIHMDAGRAYTFVLIDASYESDENDEGDDHETASPS